MRGNRRSAGRSGRCEALLLNCIDYRLQDAPTACMARIGLRNVALAGASLGALTEKGPAWDTTTLPLALDLRRIRRVVVLGHRDCGACRRLLSGAAVRGQRAELLPHAGVMRALRRLILREHPQLKVDLGLMAHDGRVEASN